MRKITKDQFDRQVKDFRSYAKVHEDDMRIVFSNGFFLVECSEIAMYRILDKYAFGYRMGAFTLEPNPNVGYGYSRAMGSYYFSLEIGFEGDFVDG